MAGGPEVGQETGPELVENEKPTLPEAVMAHLEESTITTQTANLAQIKALPEELRQAHNSQGYIIPYFDLRGRKTKHYRLRLLQQQPQTGKAKYLQPKNSQPHVYLGPPEHQGNLGDTNTPLIFVEGEKKALALQQLATQEDLPIAVVGLGGVDAWRSRTYKVNKETVTLNGQSEATIKLPSGHAPNIEEQVAEELAELADLGLLTDRQCLLLFDYDPSPVTQQHVQRAAFEFALWLFDHDADPKQVTAPQSTTDPKTKLGIDDYLAKLPVADRAEVFMQLISGDSSQPNFFPVPANLGTWVTQQLAKRKMEPKKVARAILAGLDRHGHRYYNPEANEFYYLTDPNRTSSQLLVAPLSKRGSEDRRMTEFGRLLIKEYRLPTAQGDVYSALADQYSTVEPVEARTVRNLSWATGDALYFQLGNAEVAKVTAKRISIQPNGKEVLFRSGLVEPLAALDLKPYLGRDPSLWLQTLTTLRIEPLGNLSHNETLQVLAALFHLSPLLRRWRGLMLPIEQCIAEPGSGKTFLYNLRRGVLTGRPSLDHLSSDPRSWIGSITHAPGIWVGDNLNEIPRQMRSEMEVELARLVTEPNPTISQRIMFSDNRIANYVVDCVFAVTAIGTPFHKPDVTQRSLTFRLGAIPAGRRDGRWYQRRLENRVEWVAEHLTAVQRFFQIAELMWDPEYESEHRLNGFEQAMSLMLLATNQHTGMTAQDAHRLATSLCGATAEDIVEADPVVAALKDFGEWWWTANGRKPAKAQDIVDWAQNDLNGRYSGLYYFKNSILLGRYMKQFKQVIETSANLKQKVRHNQNWVLANAIGRGDNKEDDEEESS
jgi:hypothetical protein